MAGGDGNHDDGGGRSSGEARAVATVHNRSNRLGFWDPGVVLSTVVCLDVTRVSSSHDDLVAGGNGSRARRRRWIRHEIERKDGGETKRSSRRVCRGGQWARGGCEASAGSPAISADRC